MQVQILTRSVFWKRSRSRRTFQRVPVCLLTSPLSVPHSAHCALPSKVNRHGFGAAGPSCLTYYSKCQLCKWSALFLIITHYLGNCSLTGVFVLMQYSCADSLPRHQFKRVFIATRSFCDADFYMTARQIIISTFIVFQCYLCKIYWNILM